MMTQGDFLLFILLMRKGMEGREEGKRERREEEGKWRVTEDFSLSFVPFGAFQIRGADEAQKEKPQ